MRLIVKKCLSVLFLLLLVAPLVYGQQSCLIDIENDFQDLKTSLKNPIFLDPASNSNYDDREGKKVLMVVVHHTESPTLKSTKCALNSSGNQYSLLLIGMVALL